MHERRFVAAGERFGRLVVLDGHVVRRDSKGHAILHCQVRCDCGNERIVIKRLLWNGNTRSCGCLHDETVSKRNYRHGGKHSRLYNTWCAMRSRCTNPNDNRYATYGARGIQVCAEWMNDFSTFRDWAEGAGYSETLSLERMNVDRDYEPANCCFIPMPDQSKNTTRSLWLTCFGETKTASDWSRDPRCCVGLGTLTRRIRVGWAPDQALMQPPSPVKLKLR